MQFNRVVIASFEKCLVMKMILLILLCLFRIYFEILFFFLFGLNKNVSQNGLGRGVFTSRPKICDGVFLQK